MISDHLAGHIKKTAIAQIAHHADVLRGSSRVPGVGTLDEPPKNVCVGGYPPQKLTKLHNYGYKIPRWFTQADKSTEQQDSHTSAQISDL